MKSGLERTIRTPVLALLASLIGLLLSDSAVATDIWTENFTGQEGKGMHGSTALGIVTNMSGITKWSVSGAGGLNGDASLNWWMVTNGVFEGQDVGGSLGYWESQSIDVSSNGSVQIAMDFAQIGDGLDGSGNKFEVGYRLDGGTEQDVLTIDSSNQDQFDGLSWTSITINASSATGLTVEISIKASIGDDGWSFDNVALQTATPDQPPVLSDIGDTSVESGGTLTFDVIATDFVDGDMITLSASNLPSGAVFASITNAAAVTNTFTWSSANPVGVYTTTFYAADNDGVDSQDVEITVAGFAGGDGEVWINEFHYDNDNAGVGGDTNEGFEVAGPSHTDLSDYAVYLYNGSDGSTYGTTQLSGAIDDEFNRHGAIWFGGPKNYMQNGGPDGLALVSNEGGETNLLQFISYEGEFTATDGPASGVQSVDVDVDEQPPSPVDYSLQLTGTGQGYADFNWVGPAEHSRGSLNTGQIIRLDPTILVVQ
jgi:hypothetical protein